MGRVDTDPTEPPNSNSRAESGQPPAVAEEAVDALSLPAEVVSATTAVATAPDTTMEELLVGWG